MHIVAFFILLISSLAMAHTPLKCPVLVEYGYSNKNQFKLNQERSEAMTEILLKRGYVRTGAEKMKSSLKTLKRSGYKDPISPSNLQFVIQLQIDTEYEDNTNSRSRIFIYEKNPEMKTKSLVLEARKDFKVVKWHLPFEDFTDSTGIIVRGASEKGAQKRLLKAAKKLPRCEDLIEVPKV